MLPKKISLSAKGTFAPQDITSSPLSIILEIWSLVINLEAAQGAKISHSNDQICSFICSKESMLSATKVFLSFWWYKSVICSKENPSGLITPPTRSIIPTTLAPIWAK